MSRASMWMKGVMKMESEPKAPENARRCNDCRHLYGVLVKTCPKCGSEDTEFSDVSCGELADIREGVTSCV